MGVYRTVVTELECERCQSTDQADVQFDADTTYEGIDAPNPSWARNSTYVAMTR